MLVPSAMTIAFAVGITTVLMAVNWVIWGLNTPSLKRDPSLVTGTPQTLTSGAEASGFKHVA
jgi:hypothetical protein